MEDPVESVGGCLLRGFTASSETPEGELQQKTLGETVTQHLFLWAKCE